MQSDQFEVSVLANQQWPKSILSLQPGGAAVVAVTNLSRLIVGVFRDGSDLPMLIDPNETRVLSCYDLSFRAESGAGRQVARIGYRVLAVFQSAPQQVAGSLPQDWHGPEHAAPERLTA